MKKNNKTSELWQCNWPELWSWGTRYDYLNLEFYIDEDAGDANESINEEALTENLSQVPQDAICWSSMQWEIDLESFSLWDGPTKDLGDNATAEDFFNQFIDVDYRFWLYFEKVEAW